ncbi:MULTISPECIES: acyl-CoA dehydrogenase family protein [Streptomyces]|uniref:acyl-CoA dehydrogenase family protein n=1 Tax=Streptomyces TaxID=1883 RepID=UPI00163BFB81|nr:MULTISPECIES: acyl-CoA dehydrogenase family protein [Streptomyces]MBC2879671.1 acyl-CoA dehydrogenase family protein [Streptomyces sp. TYQ1024]UBI35080.1 acyl-CoA dehydrogenase family protein [Streptomyces mobaraensis]UKW27673.1 acyl-CoA dehydrogenase family protein [Streptomyces sp. TYQ1024]
MTTTPSRSVPPAVPAASVTPTGAELVERAEALRPLLREHAPRIDADRRLTDEVVDELTRAGLFRLTVPRRFGGHETDVRTLLDVTAALAEGDGSTGWVVAVVNTCNWLASLFPEQAQEDVFGADPDARVTGVFSPTATSTRAEGGWRVSGRWYYNSGAPHSTWAVVGIPLTDAEGTVTDQAMALIPRPELRFEDTWFVAGMRGTASNCLIAEDVFVPEHRVMSVPGAIEGDVPADHGPTGLYRIAFAPFLAIGLAGPQLGLARAALKLVTEKAVTKPIAYTYYGTQAESVGVQMQVAEAALRIDTAELHVHRAVADLDTAAARGVTLDDLTRARVRADAGHAIENLLSAVNTLLDVHGAGSFADANAMQRIWRDLSVAGRHAASTPAVGREIYGKLLLGVEERITPFV